MAAVGAAFKLFRDEGIDSPGGSGKKMDRSRVGPRPVHRYRTELVRMLTVYRRNPCPQPHRRPIPVAEASDISASMRVLSCSFVFSIADGFHGC
jgi:hypothetical protein